jgi:hypothetical protein
MSPSCPPQAGFGAPHTYRSQTWATNIQPVVMAQVRYRSRRSLNPSHHCAKQLKLKMVDTLSDTVLRKGPV